MEKSDEVFIDNYNEYTVLPSKVEQVQVQKENYSDFLEELSNVPQSQLKKRSDAPRYKNGYQQGVEIHHLSMSDAQKRFE